MTPAIVAKKKRINIFSQTKSAEKLDGYERRIGQSFAETMNASPYLMLEHIGLDIESAIRTGELPDLSYRVSVKRVNPVPIFRITVLGLTDDGSWASERVQKKLAQVLWKRNADIVSFKGVYGYTHFTYQIVLLPPEPGSQAIGPNIEPTINEGVPQ